MTLTRQHDLERCKYSNPLVGLGELHLATMLSYWAVATEHVRCPVLLPPLPYERRPGSLYELYPSTIDNVLNKSPRRAQTLDVYW